MTQFYQQELVSYLLKLLTLTKCINSWPDKNAFDFDLGLVFTTFHNYKIVF